MNILTAAHDFYPDPGSGGTGRYLYETSRRLVDRGHAVTVLTRRRGNVPLSETVDGVTVSRYDLDIADQSIVTILRQLPEATQCVARHLDDLNISPDVVNSQGPVTTLLLNRELDVAVPMVTTFHSPWPVEYRIRTRRSTVRPRRWLNASLRWQLERRILAASEAVVTLSTFMKDTVRSVYDLDITPTVIPGGVDADRFRPGAGDSELVTGGSPAILTVRRLTERMGHRLLLKAVSDVSDQFRDIHLYIAGDGPLRSELEAFASSHGLRDRITFLGYVPDADLPALYASADLFVLPSVQLEGFGLATLEALAAGTPVIATPVGGTKEVLSGLETDPAYPAKMITHDVTADALAGLLCHWGGLGSGELTAAGGAARRYAHDRFSWEETVSALERLLSRTRA